MDSNARSRFVLAHVAIAVVLGLVSATAIVALRTTHQQVEEARTIDHRVAAIERLRAESRELALSARRYMLSGDLQEQQRVLAIAHDMQAERAKLGLRTAFPKGAVLEADLDEYVAALVNAMSFEDGEPIARLAHFEDELVRIRAPLSTTFDEVVSRERARREALRSAHTFARAAQWGVLIAGALGLVLVIATLRAVVRRVTSDATAEPEPGRVADLRPQALRRERLDVAVLVERAVREHREEAQQHGVRMRYEVQLATSVVGDRARIQHVLGSLLQIAIAAARRPVELVVHVAAADGGVRFAIIEPEPASEPVASDFALEVCTRIVEAHGGRLGIQTSVVSRTYWFTLPSEPTLLA